MSIATITLPAQVAVCDDITCRNATSHHDTCTCRCGGTGHGHATQVERAIGAIQFQSRRDVTSGFTRAMASAVDDEEW